MKTKTKIIHQVDPRTRVSGTFRTYCGKDQDKVEVTSCGYRVTCEDCIKEKRAYWAERGW